MTTPALVQRLDEWAGARPSHASLSVCCLTGGRYLSRTAAILGLLRPVADEIVVGVDARARESADLLGGVADRILLFSYVQPSDRPIPWLIRQCAGEWVFNIDDDEVPSGELLRELPGLIERSDVTHCWIARRWLYPDVATFLDQAPWNTEYQLRLFKSDERFLRFTDQFHRPVACRGPARFVAEPVWHLDTALSSQDDRLSKASRYEQARRGMRIGAFSHNTGLYLPEFHPGVVLAQVPPRDLATIKEVLIAPARRGGSVVIEEPSPEAVEREWPGSPHPPSLYSGSIVLLTPPTRLVGGVQQTIDARIENRGDCIWRSGDEISVGTRWDGLEGIRTSLPADVLPGESAVVPVHLIPPAEPGEHRLEVDLVHEHVRWFDCGLKLAVVVSARRVVLVAGRSDRIASVLDALALTPEVDPVIVDDPNDAPVGHPHIEGAGPYLFGPDGTDGWRAIRRASRLVLSGARHRSPARVRPLVDAIRTAEALIVIDDDLVAGAPPTRDRLRELVLVATARRCGVPVWRVGAGAPPDSRLDRLLHHATKALTHTKERDALPGAFRSARPRKHHPAGSAPPPEGRVR